MLDLKEKTIAEIVHDDISKARIFKKHNLDFCCGGIKTVELACKESNVNLDLIIKDLEKNTTDSNIPNHNFKDWNADFLIDYIINVHHSYVLNNLSILNEFSAKVAKVHGTHAPETIEIDNLFTALSNELITHIEKEETILFPAVKKKLTDSSFEYDNAVIKILEDEHEHAGIIVKEITKLSNNFSPPEWACNTYKALYYMLDEFINDLYQHIHLENNILFQKIKE